MADANSIVRRKDAAQRGHKTYFTGKPCKQGHIASRYVANGTCSDCLHKSNHEWKRRNPEHCKAYGAEHKRANADAIRIAKRAYRTKNAEMTRDTARRYRQANPERTASAMREWREKNIVHRQQYQKEWERRNPERVRELRVASRARRRSRESVTAGRRPGILSWVKRAPKICHWCGAKCAHGFHVDHYQPLSRGGRHEVSNLVIACRSCNQRKSAKDPYQFAASLGRLF